MSDLKKLLREVERSNPFNSSPLQNIRSISSSTDSLDNALQGICSQIAFDSTFLNIINTQIPESSQALIKAIQPSAAMMELHRQTAEFAKQITANLDIFEEPYRRISDSMLQTARALEPLMANIARTHCYQNRLESAGWLPHTSTPFELLDQADAENDKATLENYYLENWNEVKQVFLDGLDTLDVDNDAKNVFRQALEAHEHGLYSLTARALFPEIERVTRAELHSDEMAIVTSQKTLKEHAEKLTSYDFMNLGYWGFVLFMALDHIYDYCNTVDHKTAYSLKPIPNRHAAIHGYVVYDSICSSLNALIITEFIFQVVTALKSGQASKQKAP